MHYDLFKHNDPELQALDPWQVIAVVIVSQVPGKIQVVPFVTH